MYCYEIDGYEISKTIQHKRSFPIYLLEKLFPIDSIYWSTTDLFCNSCNMNIAYHTQDYSSEFLNTKYYYKLGSLFKVRNLYED